MLVLVAGCGDDSSAPPAGGATPSATSSAGAAKGTAAAGKTLSKKQAKAALLTVKDLPDGWTVDKDAGGEDDGETTTRPARCASLLGEDGKKPAAEAKVAFSLDGLLLQHEVSSFTADVAGDVKKFAAALAKCPKFTMIEADGTETKIRATALKKFPKLGDRSLGVRLTGAIQGAEITIDVVLVAVGHNGVTVGASGLEAMPTADLVKITRKAVVKLG